jgi:hypothetical protein
MVSEVEQIEGKVRNIDRPPTPVVKPDNPKDEKNWLLRTNDFQIWGPFSYNDLVKLVKSKKLSLYDYLAKSCSPFIRVSDIKELKTLVNQIPDADFDEVTDENIIRDLADEATIKDTVGSSLRLFKNLFNFSIIPLNTFLWIILFILVTSYCLYFVTRS